MSEQRVIMITGATSGIGYQTALAFSAHGDRVVGTGRDQERLAALAEHVDLSLTMDVTDPISVQAACAAVLERYGRVDVLVLNAGQGHFAGTLETSAAEILELMDVNLLGAHRVTQQLLPAMLQAKSGVILPVSSVAGLRAYPRHGAYCATKHALIGWAEALHCELLGTGVDVSVICPPAVDTPFFVNAGYMTFKEDHEGLELMSAEQVGAYIVQAASERPRIRVLGARARLLEGLNRVAPGALEWVRRKSGKIGV